MNNSHLHLVVNHLPIIFPIVGIIILLIGIFTKSETSKKNSYVIFIIGAIASIVAMATGENAEEAVEHIAGVSENLIKSHEESAELFAGISYALGLFSLIALISSFKNFSISKFSPYIIGVLAAITLFFAQKAGNSGGEIRHTEIRNNTSVQNSESKNTTHSLNEESDKKEETKEMKDEKSENKSSEKDDDGDND